ncbi:MAG TPA: GTP-binding protein [Steroidobacteraceae bacterium]|nr:GTP-binding protein [Steroidobacteraceae bacterium]
MLLPELPEDAAASIKGAAFSVWLSALLYARGDDIMRVKGDVQTPADRLLLQSVRHVVQSPEILPDGGDEVDGKDNSIALSAGVSIPKACYHPCRARQSEAERSRASSCWLRAPVRSMPGQRFP